MSHRSQRVCSCTSSPAFNFRNHRTYEMAACVMALVTAITSAATARAQTKTATTTTMTVTAGGSAVSTVASGRVVTLTAKVEAGASLVTTGQVNFCNASAKYCTDINVLGTLQLTNTGTAALKFRPGVGS